MKKAIGEHPHDCGHFHALHNSHDTDNHDHDGSLAKMSFKQPVSSCRSRQTAAFVIRQYGFIPAY